MKFKHQFILDRADKHTRLYRSDGILMRIDFIEDILRVALIKNEDLLPTFSIDPAHQGTGIRGRDKLSLDGFKLCAPEVHEDHEKLCFRHCGHDFTIDLLNFHITISNDKGILYEDRSGLAYNFDHELGDGSIHYTGRQEGQRIYGLGDKAGPVDKNHQRYKLDTNDSMGYKAKYSDPLYKYLPFYICENQVGSYGIYYDTYSEGEVDFGKEHDNYYEPFNSIHYEEENMVFYILLGSTKQILQKFIQMTGGIGEIPDWAFRYCGSTMEYTDAPDADARLREFADALHIAAAVRRQLVIFTDAARVRIPAGQRLIDGFDFAQNLQAGGELVQQLAVVTVARADFDFRERVQNVQPRQRDAVQAVDLRGVFDDAHVQPARAARTARRRAVFVGDFAQFHAVFVQLLRRERPFADARRVGFHDADDLVDVLRPDAEADADRARRRM